MKDLIKGVFIDECKGRFYCEVKIADIVEKCYVASSAKLSAFIELSNKIVFLQKNRNTSRTRYTLYALERDENNVILLNLNSVNEILINHLSNMGMISELFIKEKTISGCLKADVIYKSSPMIIYEVKTILSRENIAIYPGVKARRIIIQLEKIISMLKSGYKIEYIFFLLEPNINKVVINDSERKLMNLFAEAIYLNMNISIYRALWNGKDFIIEEDRKVRDEFMKTILLV